VQPEPVHYEREREFWDQMGADDYATLSAVDRDRIVDWIGWQGNGRILDIGGGAGMVSRMLVDQPGTEVVCLDISAAMLSHSPVPAVQADAMQLPLADESFDLVVAAAFLHHLPGLEAAVLEECHRVLKPGGRLVGYDPNGQSLQNRIFMGGGPTRLKRFTPDERPIVPERLEQEARAASFSSFQLDFFTFRNETKTAFETVQTYVIYPVAKGPLKKHLDRWFFWRAVK
jgi:SAM-dependent methyltransferase